MFFLRGELKSVIIKLTRKNIVQAISQCRLQKKSERLIPASNTNTQTGRINSPFIPKYDFHLLWGDKEKTGNFKQQLDYSLAFSTFTDWVLNFSNARSMYI